MEQLYCVIAECEEPTDGHGDMCSFHTKRFTRGKRGTDLRAPKAEKVSPLEKALNTVDHLYECDPNDDAEWDRRERAVKLACKVLGEEERAKVMSAAVRAGQQAARERGVHIGRKPKLSSERAHQLLAKHGSISRAARKAHVTRATFRSALRSGEQLFKKSGLSDHPSSGPREGR